MPVDGSKFRRPPLFWLGNSLASLGTMATREVRATRKRMSSSTRRPFLTIAAALHATAGAVLHRKRNCEDEIPEIR